MLTEYFITCSKEFAAPLAASILGNGGDGSVYPSATHLTYQEFPKFYTFNEEKNAKCWQRRKRPHKSDCIGRLYTVHPKCGDKYYLRMLLTVVKGAQACEARGLLADDLEWEACFQEAAHKDTPCLLRKLFVHICIHNNPISPLRLWNLPILGTDLMLHHFMSHDFCRNRIRRPNNDDFNSSDIDNCLYTIDDLLKDSSNGSATILTRQEHFNMTLFTMVVY